MSAPGSALGKRCARDGEEARGWTPGLGIKSKHADSDAKAARDLRTSLLFLELQQSVADALEWRHARDAKARKVSTDIAARCPLVFADEASTRIAEPVLSFEQKMKVDATAAKARAIAAQSLPAPLTQAVLSEALMQLPTGAATSISSVIQCWRTNKVAASDVIATAKSFSSSSAALCNIFATVISEGEVASEVQMHELTRLMST